MRILSFIMVLALSLPTFAQYKESKQTWNNDPAHSQLAFQVKHMGISKIYGQFDDYNVVVNSIKEDLSSLDIKVEAKVTSINTSIEMRDNHLRSADFFDVEKYPTLSFVSTKVVPNGKDKAKLYGNLTIKEVTKPVVLDIIHHGSYTDEKSGNRIAGFEISGTIKRLDFGVGSDFPTAVVGDDITIISNMEFISKK